uniref:Uncharacterized protein n=1 Tax=Setaria viridis TaxID=4556 RepID=A0A4U6UE71_SETVI|nr:hypothetical protein SEVIR_5G064150v2 [Setaria viridis]
MVSAKLLIIAILIVTASNPTWARGAPRELR